MPRDTFFVLAALFFAVSVALLVYGMWTWIIQFNGDVYYHRAGFAAITGLIFLVIGLVRHWRKV